MRGREGRFLGLVLGAVRLQYFEALYRQVSPSPDATIRLWREDGTLLAAEPPIPSERIKTTDAYRERIAALGQGLAWRSDPLTGRQRIIAGQNLADFPMTLRVSRDVGTILAPWMREATALGGAALAVATGVAGVVFMGLRHLRVHGDFVRSDLAQRTATAESAEHRARLAGDRRLASDKAEMLGKLAQMFEDHMGVIAKAVARDAAGLNQGASVVTDLVGGTARRAGDVSEAADRTAVWIRELAATSDTLSASMKSVSFLAARSSQIVRDASEAPPRRARRWIPSPGPLPTSVTSSRSSETSPAGPICWH